MASTTIVPFANLPACAQSCGPLYDVNGACVPPVVASTTAVVYEQCFCSDARLVAFSTTTAGVCDAACTADSGGYSSLTSWYQSMCKSVQALAVDATTSTAADGSTTTTTGTSSPKSNGGGTWMSSHWRWVVFIIVMVIGIAGIWIGAAIWRRHYLRKKDRQYALGKNLAARTGSGQNPYGAASPARSGSIMQGGSLSGRPGMFMPANSNSNAALYTEKPPKAKKKWNPMDRS